MSLQPSHNHDAVIREFHTRLKSCTQKEACPQKENCKLQGACGRDYVRFTKLEEWLRSTTAYSPQSTQVNRLLEAVYREQNAPRLPIKDFQIFDQASCCLRVFCILLKMDSGHLVHHLRRKDIVDHRLPIDLFNLRNIFELLKEEKSQVLGKFSAAEVADLFDQHQWAFCPVMFDHDQGRDYYKNHIIPICHKEIINDKGLTACLWQIVVYEEFVGPNLREQAAHLRCTDRENNSCYIFALKSFKEGYRELFKNERKAFQVFKPHGGLVRYLTEYSHQAFSCSQPRVVPSRKEDSKAENNTTHNILLEYGEFDLEEYFVERLPPTTPKEIGEFWTNLFAIADALKGIHTIEWSHAGVRQNYYGWHADIKPANILSVQGKFKLADPGFARFEKSSEKTIIAGGTTTYGAPECYRRGTMAPVQRGIDIWSLGCVFSIAATWVVLGDRGIPMFEEMRRQAIESIRVHRHSQPSARSVELAKGDYFHDSQEVLDVVSLWHKYLRMVTRQTDKITGQVLDLVDKNMLCGKAAKRIDAEKLCTKLSHISDPSGAAIEASLPGTFWSALQDVDKIAASKPVALPSRSSASHGAFSPSVSDRDARKSKFVNLPLMKTAHRSQYLETKLHTNTSPGSTEDFRSAGPVDRDVATTGRAELSYSGPYSNQQLLAPNHPSPSDPTNKRKSEDIFQAYRALHKRQKGQKLFKMFKKTPRDEFLTRYFVNRDIHFLIDNANTMVDHWDEAAMLLEVLAMKAKGLDPDGMDLSFTTGPVQVNNSNDAKAFLEALDNDNARPNLTTNTDMSASLGGILSAYIDYLKSKRNRKRRSTTGGDSERKLTVIIFTDGKWEGMNRKAQVDDTIIGFSRALEKEVGSLQKRFVSIQFVQFGNDPDASHRLRHLDNDLRYSGVDDIVDNEPSRGDVYKMLLGSFVEEFDKQNDEQEATSPTGIGNGLPIHESPSRLSQSALDQPWLQSPPAELPGSQYSLFASPYSLPNNQNGAAPVRPPALRHQPPYSP